jgi:hypothetical protein
MLTQTPGEPRRPTQTIVTNLRIKEGLRRALEIEAEKNETSLSREMVARLEASLLNNAKLDLVSLASIRADLEGLRDEMLAIWLRFKGRIQTREHEDAIITAVEEGDFETARDHVAALRRVQEIAARQRTAGRLYGHAPTVTVGPARGG